MIEQRHHQPILARVQRRCELLLPGVVASAAAGGGGYTAKAVHFDGDSYLSIASLNCTDGAAVSCFAWIRQASDDIGQLANFAIADPEDTYNSEIYCPTGSRGFSLQIANLTTSTMSVYDENLPTADTWIPYFASVTLGFNDPDKTGILYRGDTDATDFGTQSGPSAATQWNGLPFFIGNDTFGGHPFDLCDFRIMTNTYIDWSDPVKRLLFVDAGGKPVNPSVATAALGAPTMLFSGDATGFAANQGTGGAFTLTGTLTNASSSPSD